MSNKKLDDAKSVRASIQNALVGDLMASGNFKHPYEVMAHPLLNKEHGITSLICLNDMFFVPDFADHLRSVMAADCDAQAAIEEQAIANATVDDDVRVWCQKAADQNKKSAAAYRAAAQTLDDIPPWGSRIAWSHATIVALSEAQALPWMVTRLIAFFKELAKHNVWIKHRGKTYSTTARFQEVMLAIHLGQDIPALVENATLASKNLVPAKQFGLNGVSLPIIPFSEEKDQPNV